MNLKLEERFNPFKESLGVLEKDPLYELNIFDRLRQAKEG
jgi:hypothetical protein